MVNGHQSFLLARYVANSPHIQLVSQPGDQIVRDLLHVNIRLPVGVNYCLRCVSVDQHEQNPDLLQRAVRHIGQKVLPLLNELSLFDYFLRFDLLLLFLEVVLGLRLRHLDGTLFGDSLCLLLGPPPLVRRVLQLDEGNVVPDHLLGHLLKFLSLLVDPLCLLYNYIIGSVVQFAVIPNQLDVRQASFHRFVAVVAQISTNCPQIHRPLHHHRVVKQPQCYVVHWLPEFEGVLAVHKTLQQLGHLFVFFPAHQGVAAEISATLHVELFLYSSDLK